jgi:sulfur relay (sulfurtransferase) complex TusBCD TusD component (DsrE family)
VTRSLGIVVSAAADVDAALALARAGRRAGVEVGVFFMSDAVGALPGARASLDALADDDVELVACAQSAHERGLREPDVGILLGSQDDHAALVHRSDRVVAFT